MKIVGTSMNHYHRSHIKEIMLGTPSEPNKCMNGKFTNYINQIETFSRLKGINVHLRGLISLIDSSAKFWHLTEI